MAEFTARYYDGKTASRRDVTLRFGSEDLQVFDDGSIVDRWPFDTLALAPGTFDDTTSRLMRDRDDPARLLVDDPEFRAELLRRCPGIAAANSPRAKLFRFAVWTMAVSATVMVGVGAVQYLPSMGARLAPQSWEERVGIRIADRGPGIAESDREKVFAPFTRIEESRSRDTGGSGLGLALARNFVRAHGGDITLEDRDNGGLVVRVALPRSEAG